MYTHKFLAATKPNLPTLLLLHGTGGDEDDLIPLGQMLAPGAALLSPRGQVLERGMPRFFRRIREGVFDVEDLKARTLDLARFIEDSATQHAFDASNVVAVGFSNGANIAASLLLMKPGVLKGAALLHAMVPFEPEGSVALGGTRVFLSGGEQDMMVPRANTERLSEILRSGGADVTLAWFPGGHGLTRAEVDAAHAWLSRP